MPGWNGAGPAARPARAQKPQPIFYQGQAREQFEVPAAAGSSLAIRPFSCRETEASFPPDLPLPNNELTCSAEELRQQRFIDPDERIEVLAGLPG